MPDPQPPEMSRTALYAGWLVILALLTFGFANWEKNRENPNRLPEIVRDDAALREVVLKRNAYGHYVANGTINGHRVTFLLDTGATNVAVPGNLADEIGLRKMARGRASTANGISDIFYTRIPTLTIGNIVVEDVPGSINPGMNHDRAVLLGMSVLKNIEFIQQGDTLTLRQSL
ncbi:MAG: retropepsin-like aspartic protease family protein [bacterium]